MNKVVLNRLKRVIRLNLDEMTGQILKTHGPYLSKRDLLILTKYMQKHHKFADTIVKYIYYASQHRSMFNDADKTNALENACRFGYSSTVRFFLEKYSETNRENYFIALSRACFHGNDDVVKLLIADKRTNIFESSLYTSGRVILDACNNGHSKVLSLLLSDNRFTPGAANDMAIQSASEKGYTDIVSLLLADSRVNPAALNNKALENACAGGHIEVVKLLVEDERVIQGGTYRSRQIAFWYYHEIYELLMYFFYVV